MILFNSKRKKWKKRKVRRGGNWPWVCCRMRILPPFSQPAPLQSSPSYTLLSLWGDRKSMRWLGIQQSIHPAIFYQRVWILCLKRQSLLALLCSWSPAFLHAPELLRWHGTPTGIVSLLFDWVGEWSHSGHLLIPASHEAHWPHSLDLRCRHVDERVKVVCLL